MEKTNERSDEVTVTQVEVENGAQARSPIVVNGEPPKSLFDKLSSQIITRIIRLLPLPDKKSARLVNHEWVTITNELVTINFPSLSDDTRQAVCSHNGTVPHTHLHVSKLTDSIESWSETKFHHGPRIVSITFENGEISTDNMIWLLTQCYSVRELQFVISTTLTGSEGEEDLELKKRRLGELFQNVETMKAINISSRTLRNVVIKCSHVENYKTAKVDERIATEAGEDSMRTQEIDNFSSTTTNTPTKTNDSSTATAVKTDQKQKQPSSSSSSVLCFDCSMFKNCRLLQSLIITRLPFLKLKNLDELPLQIGHILLELEHPLSMAPGKNKNNNNGSTSEANAVRSVGFVDFSGPAQLGTFQYIFRVPKIRKYCTDSTLLDGQDILQLLPKIRGVSKIEWSNQIQHYIILSDKIRLDPNCVGLQS